MHFKRGTLFLTVGWGLVLAIGYLYHIWLSRQLSLALYGTYLLVMSVLQWVEITIVSGLPYGVQKFAASHPDRRFGVFLSAAKMQLIFAVLLFGITFLIAPYIANLLQDSTLTFYLRIAFIDLLIYGFFHLIVSFENSRRAFDRQALLLVLYAACKFGIGMTFVLLTHSVTGAVLANTGASVFGVLVGLFFILPIQKQQFTGHMEMLRFTAPSLVYFLLLHLFFSIDLWCVKYFLDAETVAYYGVAGLLAKIPFYLFIGVSTTLLPTLSAQLAGSEEAQARTTIRQAMRFLWLLTAPIAVLVSVNGRKILETFFIPEYAAGAPVLTILIWSISLLSIFYLLTTILNADHKPKLSFFVTSVTVVLAFILNLVLIPRWEAIGAALAMLISLAFGVLLSMFVVYKRFPVWMEFGSFLKISAAALLLWPVSVWIPFEGVLFVLALFLCVLLYFGLLFLAKEVTQAELKEMLPGISDQAVVEEE